jgi:hypothetical protein
MADPSKKRKRADEVTTTVIDNRDAAAHVALFTAIYNRDPKDAPITEQFTVTMEGMAALTFNGKTWLQLMNQHTNTRGTPFPDCVGVLLHAACADDELLNMKRTHRRLRQLFGDTATSQSPMVADYIRDIKKYARLGIGTSAVTISGDTNFIVYPGTFGWDLPTPVAKQQQLLHGGAVAAGGNVNEDSASDSSSDNDDDEDGPDDDADDDDEDDDDDDDDDDNDDDNGKDNDNDDVDDK